MATIQVELNPFPIPSGVTIKQKPGLRQNGFFQSPEMKLSELSIEALEALCSEFRSNVMKAASHQDE